MDEHSMPVKPPDARVHDAQACQVSQMPTSVRENAYARFTPKMMLQMSAPHTWAASIVPVLLSVGFAYAALARPDVAMILILLAICVLMQSAVNVFNDYFDYVKGVDSVEDDVDVTDSILVYNKVNPRCALVLAIVLLVGAFILGLYVIYVSGYIPLVIALIGAVVVVLYSGGKTPISYLPIGEVVSGFVMGALICLACFYVFTMRLEPLVLVWSLPAVIGIALIMMTNNTCDIEKDTEAKRSTLPRLLGRKYARRLYRVLLLCWYGAIVVNVAVFFLQGWPLLVFMALITYPLALLLWKNPLAAHTRQAAMGQICNLNITLGAFYTIASIASVL